jgi:drug/metabolite transporter (DMT)-like permease
MTVSRSGTAALTAITMVAFASNSILCRKALGDGLVDPATFTLVRAASGSIMLALIVLLRSGSLAPSRIDWLGASMLFLYMVCFSYAYLSLSAGTGALILFGAVQVTMILFALRSGERLSPLSWAGLALAVAGLAWLVSPGVTAPDATGAVLMAAAGAAWGAYSLLGRKQGDPAASTARNFLLATPLAMAVSLATMTGFHSSWAGLGLAAVSGGVASALGYVVWYTTVPRLTAVQASSVQLTVPVIAAVIGVVLLSETVTGRLLTASLAILSGVGIVVAQRAAKGARSDSRRKPA